MKTRTGFPELPINTRISRPTRRRSRIVSHEGFSQWLTRRRAAKPFLRWAGGKTPFLYRYGDHIPRFHGKYVEPFLGSGAVFFYLQRTQARPTPSLLGDSNLQLILTFYAVRDEPERVFEMVSSRREQFETASNQRQYYESVRAEYNAHLPNVQPADFIFLNRTCWNGLYRLNRAGEFNVPLGKGPPIFPTLEELFNASAALSQAQLRAGSWENVIASCEKEDFVFLDPPYFSDLTSSPKYNSFHFDLNQHVKLAKCLRDLQRRGIDFILTNSGEEEIIAVYRDAGLFVEPILVQRSISSDTDNRNAVPEIIVTPKPPLKLL